MASKTKTSQFDTLNVFIHERLAAIAGEIFQVVADSLAAFQEELERSRQENVHLRKLLTAEGADAPNKKPDGSPPEREESYQGPPDSDLETSVIQVKLELSSVPQDPEAEQLPTASTCDSVLATRGQGPPHVFSGKTNDSERKGDADLCMDSYAAIKLERCDPLVICSDKSHASEVQNGCSNTHLKVIKDECEPSSHFNSSSADVSQSFNLESLTTEVLIYCELCGKHFNNDVLLKKHIVKYHEEKPHHCEFCGKCFTYPYALKLHLRTHTGEKPYHCKFCGKTFGHKGHVKDHERIHTGEKPHCCSICGKCFIRTDHVKLHIQNHHIKQTSSAVKKCAKYGESKQKALNAYCCELCGKRFVNQHAVRVHYRIHTGERPYNCRFCDKAFRQKSHMKDHERTHTGEKIYNCSACGLSFTWWNQAKAHVQEHRDHIAKIVRKQGD